MAQLKQKIIRQNRLISLLSCSFAARKLLQMQGSILLRHSCGPYKPAQMGPILDQLATFLRRSGLSCAYIARSRPAVPAEIRRISPAISRGSDLRSPRSRDLGRAAIRRAQREGHPSDSAARAKRANDRLSASEGLRTHFSRPDRRIVSRSTRF